MHSQKLKKAVLLAALFAAMIIAAGCGMSHEESIAQKDVWAEDVVRKAVTGLAQAHAIAEPAPDAEILDEMFTYTYIGGLEFYDPNIEHQIFADYYLPKRAKVIVATSSIDKPIQVLFYDKNHYMQATGITDEKAADKPIFTPMYYNKPDDPEIYENDLGIALSEAVGPSRFADGLDKADYLIVYDYLHSKVEPNYYQNGIDRTTVTTVVMVINVKHLEVEHMQVIGIDIPSGSYSLGGHIGKFKKEETLHYLIALLAKD